MTYNVLRDNVPELPDVEDEELPIIDPAHISIIPIELDERIRINNTWYTSVRRDLGNGFEWRIDFQARVVIEEQPLLGDVQFRDNIQFVVRRMLDDQLAWVHIPEGNGPNVRQEPNPIVADGNAVNIGLGNVWMGAEEVARNMQNRGMWEQIDNGYTYTFNTPNVPEPPAEEINGSIMKVDLDKVATMLAQEQFLRENGEAGWSKNSEDEIEIDESMVDVYMEMYDKYYDLLFKNKI